jgi:hypothetical protein
VGFEPTRGNPIGLAGRRLNRSAKLSSACCQGINSQAEAKAPDTHTHTRYRYTAKHGAHRVWLRHAHSMSPLPPPLHVDRIGRGARSPAVVRSGGEKGEKLRKKERERERERERDQGKESAREGERERERERGREIGEGDGRIMDGHPAFFLYFQSFFFIFPLLLSVEVRWCGPRTVGPQSASQHDTLRRYSGHEGRRLQVRRDMRFRTTKLLDSLRGSSVQIGTIQRRLAWPLRKDDTHKSKSVNSCCRPPPRHGLFEDLTFAN